LVSSFSELFTDTQGFVSRDDSRKEIVVSFRGSAQIPDFFTDLAIIQVPLTSTGIKNIGDAYVHSGFLNAYNSVSSAVISTVRGQLASHPGYTVISTGHSLGGSLAAIGALGLKSNFPSANVKLYTYGQPRTGNGAWASLVDSVVGTSNIYRAVHTFDGVPTIIPTFVGYQHHGTEFWNYAELPSAGHTKQCSGDEDSSCSKSIPSSGINLAHATYFGQLMTLNPLVCV